ncbi:MAG TPA: AAA family ATPase [Solirubrobacteraceae bacterium]|nr:AAA family ATPase [Solirubrobacteraceae bacterium]
MTPEIVALGRAGGAHSLRTLVLARSTAVVIETSEEQRVDDLADAVASDLGLEVFEWTVTRGLSRRGAESPVYDTGDARRALAGIRDLSVEALFVLKDIAPALAAPEVSRQFRELVACLSRQSRLSTLVLVGAPVTLPVEVEPHVTRLELPLPSQGDYRRTVSGVIESLQATGRARATLSVADQDVLAAALSGLTLEQARQAVAQVAIDDGELDLDDGERLLALKARALGDDGLLEYVSPTQSTAELGGFEHLEAWLDRARIGFTEQAAALDLPAPRGVLLVGVQGCGKSLAARAIARRWELPLLGLDIGRLFDKFVGESERRFRHAIEIAESLAPVVLWIDEIEKGLAPAGGGDADGGLSQRLFGSFLTWMQEKQRDVFVVATANDLSRVPAELLRKGRFDEVFFVDLPDRDERTQILRIHLLRHHQDPNQLDLAALAGATDGFSGAELERLVITSLLRSLQESRHLDQQLVRDEAAELVPLSVSRAEEISRLRADARSRFVPVHGPLHAPAQGRVGFG